MNKSILFLFLSIIVLVNRLIAQDTWCGFNDTSVKEYYQNHPEENKKIQNQVQFYLNNNSVFDNRATRTIPVVVHVIHDGINGNISDAQIQDALDVINRDFSAQSSNIADVPDVFKPVIANLNIEFKLAKVDPIGNCTNGIVRVDNSSLTYNSTEAIKFSSQGGSSQWNPSKYFNIWVVNSINSDAVGSSGIVIGYAQFPFNSQPLNSFGLVMRADHMGTIEEALSSDGTVLSHEVGHCFGLFHTFHDLNYTGGEGCNPGSCFTNGDNVCDTPPATSTSSCADRNTCDIVPQDDYYGVDTDDMKENFMAYSSGCLSMFTLGQKARMETYLANYVGLKDLYTQPNVDYTGVLTNGVVCKADFSVDRYSKCVGDEFIFTDKSYSNIVDWNWDFGADATPQFSNEQHPKVIYSTSGEKIVKLIVSDGVNSLEVEKNISVTNLVTNNFKETFGKSLSFYDNYINNTSINKGWNVSSIIGRDDERSLYVNNYSTNENTISEYSLYAFDLNAFSDANLSLSFYTSYALKTLNDEDYLRIYFTTDCGLTWKRIKTYTSFDLFNTQEANSEYFPISASDWKQFVITIDAEYFVNGFGVKFEHSGGDGNNLFLDDIMIANTTDPSLVLGLNDIEAFVNGFKVYPNPTKDLLNLEFEILQNSNVKISLKDILGRDINMIESKPLNLGNYQYKVDMSLYQKGIYFIDVNIDGKHQIKKVVLE